LAIDLEEENLKEVADIAAFTAACDTTDANAMRSVGIEDMDAVVICIGNDMEESILTALVLKELGVGYIAASAKSRRHQSVLEKIGVDYVIIPELEAGKRLAAMLANPGITEVFELGDNFNIIEAEIPPSFYGKTIIDLDLRKTYSVNVLLLRRGKTMVVNISGETRLVEGDVLVVAGENDKLMKFAAKISK
jgi:trk system potassium uptake protein TrkA